MKKADCKVNASVILSGTFADGSTFKGTQEQLDIELQARKNLGRETGFQPEEKVVNNEAVHGHTFEENAGKPAIEGECIEVNDRPEPEAPVEAAPTDRPDLLYKTPGFEEDSACEKKIQIMGKNRMGQRKVIHTLDNLTVGECVEFLDKYDDIMANVRQLNRKADRLTFWDKVWDTDGKRSSLSKEYDKEIAKADRLIADAKYVAGVRRAHEGISEMARLQAGE